MATKNSAALNRTLFLEDNLPVMRGLDSESIDLIATDPPFNKGVGAFEGTTKAGENVEFKDVWHWGDVQEKWVADIEGDHPRLYDVIRVANSAAGDGMGAFLCWMSVRVLEMHRVLKSTGSIYLHCDPTASHYLKAMLDAVFGRKNFRNEIVWKRTSTKSLGNTRFAKDHDVILYYVKSEDSVWNQQYSDYSEEYLAKNYRHSDEHGLFSTTSLTGGKAGSPEAYLPFKGVLPSSGRAWAPLSRSKFPPSAAQLLPDDYESLSVLEKCAALDSAGLLYWTRNGIPRQKSYLSVKKGVVASDIITDINPVGAQSKERTGYPTQKPIALYKRMIEASSNPGDMVLDPFAGCATTCVAAEQLGRQWIGIDIQEKAGAVIRDRLQNEVNGSMAWNDIVLTPTEAPMRTDGGESVAPELVVVGRKEGTRRLPVRKVREELLIRDGQRCQGCGWEPQYADYLQIDHKKPRSLGGEDDMDNLTLLCDPCNRMKSNKLTLTDLRQARVGEGRMDADWWERERWM